MRDRHRDRWLAGDDLRAICRGRERVANACSWGDKLQEVVLDRTRLGECFRVKYVRIAHLPKVVFRLLGARRCLLGTLGLRVSHAVSVAHSFLVVGLDHRELLSLVGLYSSAATLFPITVLLPRYRSLMPLWQIGEGARR